MEGSDSRKEQYGSQTGIFYPIRLFAKDAQKDENIVTSLISDVFSTFGVVTLTALLTLDRTVH